MSGRTRLTLVRLRWLELAILVAGILVVLLPLVIVALPASTGDDTPLGRRTAASCWSDPRIPTILALGRDRAPDAQAKLEAIASEAQASEGREMARVMLQHWDVKDGSYRAAHAQRIGPFTVSIEEKRKVLPRVIRQTILIFDVLVDEQGCTAKVDVVRRGDYPAFLELVLAKVKKLRYVPRKDGNDYVPEKLTLTFNQEVG